MRRKVVIEIHEPIEEEDETTHSFNNRDEIEKERKEFFLNLLDEMIDYHYRSPLSFIQISDKEGDNE